MTDREIFDEMERLREQAGREGPTPLLLSTFLRLAISLHDRDDRFGYIANAAEWLATQGRVEDIKLALLLLRTTNPIDKAVTFPAIVSRLVQENLPQKALAVLAEAEEWATAFENEPERLECSCERANFWNDLGDWYDKMGARDKALTTWARATRLAQTHQYDDETQNMAACMHLLRQLAKKFITQGNLEAATSIVESIRNLKWRDEIASLIAERRKAIANT